MHLQLWFLFLQVCLSSVAAAWSQFYWRQSENREDFPFFITLIIIIIIALKCALETKHRQFTNLGQAVVVK